MTLNNIEAIFKDIANRHKQINSFYNQQAFDVTSVEEVIYPSLVINTNEIKLPKTAGGYTSKNYSIELQIIDLVHKDESNKQEVLSDVDSILNDIVSELSSHPVYIESGITLLGDITLNPLKQAYGDEISGWNTIFVLELPHMHSWCGSPLELLEGVDNTPKGVTITDAENPASPITLYEGSYSCIEAEPKAGIAYSRPMLTNQKVSYSVGDDGWHFINGTYNYTPPTNPLSIASLSDSLTLVDNNAFGNKDRFTDINGLQVYSDNYFIDHWSGLGYTNLVHDSKNWEDGITFANNSTLNGFNDWRITNINELDNLFLKYGALPLDYTPINTYKFLGNLHTSTTRFANTAQDFYIATSNATRSVAPKTGIYKFVIVRNHYN